MLIALAISAMVLTAVMSALNYSFKAYQNTTESVSTHVVARNAMARITAMIRVSEAVELVGENGVRKSWDRLAIERGSQGPASLVERGQVVAGAQIENPTQLSPFDAGATQRVAGIAIKLGPAPAGVTGERWVIFRAVPEQTGPNPTSYALQYSDGIFNPATNAYTGTPFPVLRGLKRCRFELKYNPIGWLERATLDLVLAPNDYNDAIDYTPASGTPAEYRGADFVTRSATEHIRLVGSAAPRRFANQLN